MGFWDKFFGRGSEPISDEIKQARERHGINPGEEEEQRPGAGARGRFEEEPYDPWEELRNIRSNFWVGGWAARRLRWRPNTDKLREDLEEMEKEREEKQRQKIEKAEARGDTALKAKLEETARKREEKVRKRLEKEREREKGKSV